MFNLLRRKRQRKTHDVSDEEETATTKITRAKAKESGASNERYRQFSRLESGIERERVTSAVAGEQVKQAARRAVIEELEDFGSDEQDEDADDDDQLADDAKERASVKLAKTAANGNSASSCQSIINNMGKAIETTTRTTTAYNEDDRQRNCVGRTAAAGSPNESVSASDGGQLIGKVLEKDDEISNETIVPPIIDNGLAVSYRQHATSNEQKRQARLSLGNLSLQLGRTQSASVDKEKSSVVEVPKTKRKALQKSRDFLSDIFMARGRNHNRHKQPQQQQQQTTQQLQQKEAHIKAAAADVIIKALAKGSVTLAAAPAHLETNSDPAGNSTNSYQMTMSNNSAKNFHGALQSAEEQAVPPHPRERERHAQHAKLRSNSAECETRTGASLNGRATSSEREEWPPVLTSRARAHSVEPRDFIQAANVERHVAFARNAEDCHDKLLDGNAANCIADHDYTNNSNYNASDIIMGQSSAKPQEQCSPTAVPTTPNTSRASTPREFRESIIIPEAPIAPPRAQQTRQRSPNYIQRSAREVEVPKITVVDCSYERNDGNESSSCEQSPIEAGEELFYDFEQHSHNSNINITPVEELHEAHIETLEDEVFEADVPTTVYQNGLGRPWTRLSHMKLENVQEVAEEDELDEALELDDDLDNERDSRATHTPQAARKSYERQSASSERRSPLKSDSNLSCSYADSGIGHNDSQHSSVSSQPNDLPSTPPRSFHSTHNTTSMSATAASTSTLRTPFVRDGNSTDCEETLLQCDELDDEHFSGQFNERLVCIESISLPDVVVESTTGGNGSASSAQSSNGSHTNGSTNDTQINININGASGNSVGNVHFIPIHIEGGAGSARSRSNSPKHRSLDDSCIGRNMPPTIEIIEDGSVLNNQHLHQHQEKQQQQSTYEADMLRQELKLQKARHSQQLDDTHKNVHNLEAKVSDMQIKIQKLEQELSQKQWNVERLQGELNAADKDDEYVRKKLKLLEDEKTNLRHKYNESEDEFRRKYDELEAQYNELTEKYKQNQSLASSLQTQLACAQADAEKWRSEVTKIRLELEDQIRILKNALENSEAERKICEDKWQKEFELLRTHNREREDTLMTDCEWQLRQMQRQCKDKLDKSTYERKQALAQAEELEQELQSRRKETEHLRLYQAQVNSLRGVVSEQEHSIQTLMERIDNLKAELETANENLESQIEAVTKIKYQCDNAIYDKERQMIYRIDEVRNEAAAFWENKLYTEMTRLTNELESVYVDERREALDKLQNEHVEELRALTNRYSSNEEEMRAEIDELHENLELKKQDFLALRERSDNALLQTRMHLDRADREYQNAMCREEDRRVALEEKLKNEFELEKQEMEQKFLERLSQVKEEFAKELQISTQEVKERYRKELELQKAKLQAEKEEAVQELVERHRAKMAAAEERINDVELRHQRDLKDLKAAYDAEKAALDKRDISNANEIEQLHRKCRCLTNLFEEMRMRYERRDPRAEDLREIADLRARSESQERDLYTLTDRLRDMQIQMSELQRNGNDAQGHKMSGKTIKKPPPKTIPTSCDVIYEENEERESPVLESPAEEQENEQTDEDDEEQEPSDTESNHTIEVNGKLNDHINEDDAHMITAV